MLTFAKLTLFATLLMAYLNAFASGPSSKSCDYYFEVEKTYKCGAEGYPLNFGLRLCQRYLNAEPRLSSSIKRWFPKIRSCLQQYIEKENGSIRDCQDLKKKALDSHIPCYVQTGFCSLSAKDVLKIIHITSTDIVNPDIISMSIKVLNRCAEIK